MTKDIYTLFIEKMPLNSEELLPLDSPKLITFLNPYTAYINRNRVELFEKFDYTPSDGILPILILEIFGRKKRPRISFDMTSFAPILFDYCIANKRSIFFIGSTQENIEAFTQIIQSQYTELNIAGASSGYFDDFATKVSEIKSVNPDFVVVGMGSPRQDKFAIELREQGYQGSIYTCGGFFSQTTDRVDYYPRFINELHLRAFYRMYKEQHVIQRLLVQYPLFTCSFVIKCIKLAILNKK